MFLIMMAVPFCWAVIDEVVDLCVLQLVLALYPQTTCFYRAVIHEPPKRVCTDLIACCYALCTIYSYGIAINYNVSSEYHFFLNVLIIA